MTTSQQSAVLDRDLELLDRVAEVAGLMHAEVAKRIIGQHDVVGELLTALLANGHALLVGVPGLAKTLLVQTIADALRDNRALTSLNLNGNRLCGLDKYNQGTYDATGIIALANALHINGALTSLALDLKSQTTCF